MFLDEARITAQLSDPHVVKVLDHGVMAMTPCTIAVVPHEALKALVRAAAALNGARAARP